MCEKCMEHVKCPVGEKRVVEVVGEKETIIDAYGHKLFVYPWEMVVDKYPDRTEAVIKQTVIDENFVNYGSVLEITHCPWCGERLV